MQETKRTASSSRVERFFAIFGAVLCLAITIILWWSISLHQPLWPFPALYFIEVTALSLLSASLLVIGSERGKYFVWGSIGVLGGFTILGALSVGFFYLPVALIFAILSIISAVRTPRKIMAYLGVCFLGGVIQVALMFAVIRFVFPGAVF